MNRREKSTFILLHVLILLFSVSLIKTSTRGYNISLVESLSPVYWGIIAACVILYGIALFQQYKTSLALGVGMALSVLLLFLPSILTRGLYGPDSYSKASTAKRVAVTGTAELNLYPGMSTFSAMVQGITELPIWLPIMLASAMLAPLSGLVFYRRYRHLPKTNLAKTTAMLFTVFLPLGFGVWLSTKSTYHSFFLSLPLAVVFLAISQRSPNQSWRFTLILLFISTSLVFFHPLLFLFCAAIVFTLDSLTESIRQGIQKNVGPLFAVGVVFVYFLFIPSITPSLLLTIGVPSFLGGESVSAAPQCVDDPATPFTCSVFSQLGIIALPLVIVGLTSVLAIVFLLREHRNINIDDRLVSSGVHCLILSGTIGIIGVGMLPRQVFVRSLGFVTILVLPPLAVLSNRLNEGEDTKQTSTLIVVCMVLIAGGIVPFLYPDSTLNDTPNFTFTDNEEAQILWIAKYRPVGSRLASTPHSYAVFELQQAKSGTKDSSAFTGSVHLLSTIAKPSESELIRSYLGHEGTPVPTGDLHYVLTTAMTCEYLKISYLSDGIKETTTQVCSSEFGPKDSKGVIFDSGEDSKTILV